MLNKYVYRSRISEKQFRDIVKYFAVDLEADQVAKIIGLSRNTINKYFKAMRVRNGLADIGYGKHFRVHHGEMNSLEASLILIASNHSGAMLK